MLTLNDPTLLRSQCLIDGQWLAADDARTVDVTDPASGERRVVHRVVRRGKPAASTAT